MRLLKVVVVCVVGLLMTATGGAEARRRERHRRGPQKYVPVYRAMDDPYTLSTTQDQTDQDLELVQSKPISSTKFLLLKAAASTAAATANPENWNSGRTFKHLLLYKNLLRPDKEEYVGGGGGYMMPYIIINTPTNLTNINNNTLNNAPAAPAAATTGTGGTGGTRMGGIGGGGLTYFRNPQQALPMPIQMPTQVYQQREGNGAQLLPYNVIAMMGLNGLNGGSGGLMPLAMPVLGNPNQRRRAQPQRRRAPPQPTVNRNNPFAAFANSFRGIQFL